MKTVKILSSIIMLFCAMNASLAQSSMHFDHIKVEQQREPVSVDNAAIESHRTVARHAVQINNVVSNASDTDESVEIYAFTEWNLAKDENKGLIKFNSNSPKQISYLNKTDLWATAGAYAEEDYYIMANDNSFNPTLYTIDLATKKVHGLGCDVNLVFLQAVHVVRHRPTCEEVAVIYKNHILVTQLTLYLLQIISNKG